MATNVPLHRTEVITFNAIEGFHFWKDAPAAVGFLKDNHRHMFHVRCFFEVNDLDREVEIILMQREVESYLHGTYGKPCQFGGMSCEMIAEELLVALKASCVEVLEDGEGGAIVRE